MLDLYPKINSIYKRDDRGQFLDGQWSTDEIAYLADHRWRWTEKVDGTNIRLGYDGHPRFRGNEADYIRGRTDLAQIPPKLLAKLLDRMRRMAFEDVFGTGEVDVTLYGEGYGAGIQKGGGNYIPDGCDFVLFDMMINGWWLKREVLFELGLKLGLTVVPVVLEGSIYDAIDVAKDGYTSKWQGVKIPEGLVGVPLVDLFDRGGNRIMTKVKHRDFK